MAEIWDIVDAKGEKTGVKWDRVNHDKIPKGMYHPCVEVWVKIGDKLLITKRHPDKTEGLKYDVPGGAVIADEDMQTGAMRELYEEAGISVDSSSFKELGTLTNGNVYAASYLVELNYIPEIKLQASEVVGYKLVTQDELEEMLDELTRGTKSRYYIYKEEIFPAKKQPS